MMYKSSQINYQTIRVSPSFDVRKFNS